VSPPRSRVESVLEVISALSVSASVGIVARAWSILKAGVGVLIACVTWASVQVALGQRQGLPAWLLPTVLAFPVLLIFLVIYLSRRQRA
jgi:uncharacterized membrane protein